MKSKTILISTLFAAAAAGTLTAGTATRLSNTTTLDGFGEYAGYVFKIKPAGTTSGITNSPAPSYWGETDDGTLGWVDLSWTNSSKVDTYEQTVWYHFTSSTSIANHVYGNTLFIDTSSAAANMKTSWDFGPITLGGLIVDGNYNYTGTPYTFGRTAGDAELVFDGGNAKTNFKGTINADVRLQATTITFSGTQNWTIADGKKIVFYTNNYGGNGNLMFSGKNSVVNFEKGSGSGSGTIGSIHTANTDLNFNAGTIKISRLETGDADSGDDSVVTIGKNSKLLVSGSENTGAYKTTSILLGEWSVKTALNIEGAFLAKDAEVCFGDKGGSVVVKSGATMAVKGYGVSTKYTPTESLTVESGAKLFLGRSGLKNISGTNTSASITAATIASFDDSTKLEKTIHLGAGTTTIDTDKYVVDMSAGTVTKSDDTGTSVITVSGIVSGNGGFAVIGGGVLNLNAANTFTGGLDVQSGRVVAGSRFSFGGGNVTIAAGAKLESAVENTVFSGEVANSGTIQLTNGGTFSGKVTNTGTLDLSGNITFSDAASVSSGRVMLASGAEVSGLTVSNGSLSLAGKNTLTGTTLTKADLTISGSAANDSATAFAGTLNFTSGSIDLSSVSFVGNSLSCVIFDVSALTSGTNDFFSALQYGSIETIFRSGDENIGGYWSLSDNKIIFNAAQSNMISWSAGVSKGNGTWNATNFNGQNVGGTAETASTLVFDTVDGVENVTVTLSGNAFAEVLQVSSETDYTIFSANSTLKINRDLRVIDGTLTVRSKMIVGSLKDGSDATAAVQIQSGGKIEALNEGALQTDSISLESGAVLTLGNEKVLSGVNKEGTAVTMEGGSTISFVQGALSGAKSIVVNNAGSAGTAAVLSLQDGQLPDKDKAAYQLGNKLSFESGSWITFDVGENSWLDLTGAHISTPGNFTKTGAGTLVLTDAGSLSGGLTIDGGTVALGAAGSGSPVFAGTLITVNAGGKLALIRSNSFSSNAHSAQIKVYGNLHIGQDTVYDGIGADVPTQNVDGLTFDLYGGSVTGVETNDYYLLDVKNLFVNAHSGTGDASVGRFIIKLNNAEAIKFNVEAGTTLVAASTFVEATGNTHTGFSKSGAGTLVLADSPVNNIAQMRLFTGTVAVNEGGLEVQGTLGNAGTVSLAADTKLTFNSGNTKDAQTIFAKITGSGSVAVESGKVVFSDADAFSDAFSGTLTIDSGATMAACGSLTGLVSLGGTLASNGNSGLEIRGTLHLCDGATIGWDDSQSVVDIFGVIDLSEYNTLILSGKTGIDSEVCFWDAVNTNGAKMNVVVQKEMLAYIADDNTNLKIGALTMKDNTEVAGKWEVDSLALSGEGKKTLSGTVSVASGTVSVESPDAVLVLAAGGKLSGNAQGLTLDGRGTLENEGTISGNNLVLALNPSSGTAIKNSGVIEAAVSSTVGKMTIRNSGTLALANAAITGSVSVQNTGTVSGNLTVVDKNDTFEIRGGTFGNAGEEIKVSGAGVVKVDGTTVQGSLHILNGNFTAAGSLGEKVSFNSEAQNSVLDKITIDNGSLTCSLISVFCGADGGIAVEAFNNSKVNTNELVFGRKQISSITNPAMISVRDSDVNGSLTIMGSGAELSNTLVSNVLKLQSQIDLATNNRLATEGPSGSVALTLNGIYNPDNPNSPKYNYSGVRLVNDASLGGIRGGNNGQLTFATLVSGSYSRNEENANGETVTINTRYTINSLNLSLNIKNADSIGESYALYSGNVVVERGDLTLTWGSGAGQVQFSDNLGYAVKYNGDDIVNISLNFVSGESGNLYLDVNKDGIFVKRAGTLVWNNAWNGQSVNWSGNDWERTQKNATNLSGQTFSAGDYVSIVNATGTLVLDQDAQVGGLNFKGCSNFTLDQNGSSFWSGKMNVESGVVAIENLGANDLNRLIIADGATLTLKSVSNDPATGNPIGSLVGQGDIQLAGTLAFNTGYTGVEGVDVVSSNAKIFVAGTETVSLGGDVSGENYKLTKTGAGKLTFTGEVSVAELAVSEGAIDFAGVSNVTLGVKTLTMAKNTSVSSDILLVSTDLDLGKDAKLTVANTSSSQKLKSVVMAAGSSIVASENAASSAVLNLDSETSVTTTGNALIDVKLAQTAGETTLIDTAAGTLTLGKDIDVAGTLLKSGAGTLKLAETLSFSSGTIAVSAGVLEVGNVDSWGTLYAAGGATLLLTGETVSSDASSVLAVAEEKTLTLKANNALSFNGNLAVAGTLKIDAGSAVVTLAGTDNAYNRIEFKDLTLADGFVASAAGTLSASGTSSLTLEGTTVGNLGSVYVGGGKTLTLSLAATSDAQFNSLTGSRNAQLKVSGLGTASFAFVDNVKFDIGNEATLKVAAGTLAAVAGTGTFEKIGDGTLVSKTKNEFEGTVKVSEGTLALAEKGSFGKAAFSIDGGASVLVVNDGAVTVGGDDAVAKTISGNGRFEVSGGTLRLADSEATENFAGTIAVSGGGEIYTKNISEGLTVEITGGSELIDDSSATLSEVKVDFNGTAFISVKENQALTVKELSYTGGATGTAGTLAVGGEGSVEILSDITGGLNLSADAVELVVKGPTAALVPTATELGTLNAANGAIVDMSEVSDGSSVQTVGIDGGTVKLNLNKLAVKYIVSQNKDSVLEAKGTLSSETIGAFTGTVKASGGDSDVLLVNLTGSVISNSDVVFEAVESGVIKMDLSRDMVQGGAKFAGSGTIELDTSDHTLTLSKPNNDFAGKLKLSGTLKMTEGATLGTANVEVNGANSELTLAAENNKKVVAVGGNVSGDGIIRKTGGASAFVGGEISVPEVILESGSLAVVEIEENTTITFAGAAIFETGKELSSDGKLKNVEGDVTRLIHGVSLQMAPGAANATFSHSSENGKTAISGNWISGVPTSITLAGGGSGSALSVDTGDAAVKKTGEGVWGLDFAASGNLSVEGGTLSVRKFKNTSAFIAGAGTLEITGFDGPDNVLSGDFSGTGVVAVGTNTTLGDLGDNSKDLILKIGRAVTLEVAGDLDNRISADVNSKLNFNADTDFTYTGTINGLGKTYKIGAGTLKLGPDFNVENDFIIKNDSGTVVLTGNLGGAGSSKFEVGSDSTLSVEGNNLKIDKKITGSGTVDFVSGTKTTLTSDCSEFEGTVDVADGAELIYKATNIEAGFTEAASITGAGTITIDFNREDKGTSWSDSATAFEGTIQIKKGVLEIKAGTLNSLVGYVGEIVFAGTADDAAVLKLTGANNTELGNYSEKIFGGVGAFAIDSGSAKLSTGKSFASTIKVLKDGKLTLETGATLEKSLVIDENGEVFVKAASSFASPVVFSAFSVAPSVLPAAAGTGPLVINGDLMVNGTMTFDVTPVVVNGAATFSDTARVVLSELPEDNVLLNCSNIEINPYATFELIDGTRLSAANRGSVNELWVDIFIDSEKPKGLESFAKLIDSQQASAIWAAVNHSSGDQRAIMRNFSPVSFGALHEMAAKTANSGNDLLRQRFEQRRFDRAFPMAMLTGTNTFYANTFGSMTDVGSSNGKNANYDTNIYGVQAGFDTIVSGDAISGVNLTYASGKADIHNNGGKHEMDSIGVGAYTQYMLDEVSYFGLGARAAFNSYDIGRRTTLGEVSGESSGISGYDLGLSATLGRLFLISQDCGLSVSPYVGLDLNYSIVNSFEEERNSQGTAFDVDSSDRLSLRGVAGMTLTWNPTSQWRFSIDAAVHYEFLDNESDIEATFLSGDYDGKKAKVKAYYGNETTLSAGPRIEYRFNESWAVNAAYTYETDFDETSSHSANIGLRARF